MLLKSTAIYWWKCTQKSAILCLAGGETNSLLWWNIKAYTLKLKDTAVKNELAKTIGLLAV